MLTVSYIPIMLQVSLLINRGMFGHNKVVGMALVRLDQVKFDDSNHNSDVSGHYKLLAAARWLEAP